MSWIDRNLKKVLSRKLLVFIIATFSLFFGTLSGDQWLIIACFYLSVQGAIDIIDLIKIYFNKQ